MFILVLKEYEITVTKNELKSVLNKKYVELSNKYGEDKILTILFHQGKNNLIRLVRSNNLTLENLIVSDDYYLTTLDMWVLSLHYKIDLIFISSTKLMEVNSNILLTNNKFNSNVSIVHIPGIKNNAVPVYSLIRSEGNNYKIFINPSMKELEDHIKKQKKITLEEFIKDFKPKKPKAKKKLVLRTESASELASKTVTKSEKPKATKIKKKLVLKK